jgi:hypothetical protein
LTTDYEQEMQEIGARNGLYDKVIIENEDSGGNGHAKQITQQVEKAEPVSLRHKPIALHSKKAAKPKSKEPLRECEQCNKTTTYINPKGKPVWHGNTQDGWVCNACYFKMRRLDLAPKSNEKIVDIGALFEQQIQLLQSKQAKIRIRLAEIEQERARLVAQARHISKCLMSVDK